MEKVFSIGFWLAIANKPFFYGYNPNQGAFLTPDIRQAYHFMSLRSAYEDAPELSKFFFAYPVEYSIYKGTKK